MKTLGRILIILTVFTVVMGITYTAVSASSSSTSANAPAFESGDDSFRPLSGAQPDFDREGPGGGSWGFGLVKNIGIVVVIVALIVVPKSFMRRKSRPIRVR